MESYKMSIGDSIGGWVGREGVCEKWCFSDGKGCVGVRVDRERILGGRKIVYGI